MPSDFISLLSADLDLNSPKSLYSKESVYDLLPDELQLPPATPRNAAEMSQNSSGGTGPPPAGDLASDAASTSSSIPVGGPRSDFPAPSSPSIHSCSSPTDLAHVHNSRTPCEESSSQGAVMAFGAESEAPGASVSSGGGGGGGAQQAPPHQGTPSKRRTVLNVSPPPEDLFEDSRLSCQDEPAQDSEQSGSLWMDDSASNFSLASSGSYNDNTQVPRKSRKRTTRQRPGPKSGPAKEDSMDVFDADSARGPHFVLSQLGSDTKTCPKGSPAEGPPMPDPNGPGTLSRQHPARSEGKELKILVQPETQHRARYLTEGSRGSVKDRTQQGFPTVKLEGVKEPVVLQVFVGNDTERVKPHGFYQACRVTGRNTTACTERDIEGTTVIEVHLDPSNNMILAVDCVGILKLRNADVEARIGVAGSKKKSTRARLVFRVNVPRPDGSVLTLQVPSSPILCTQPAGVPEIVKKSLHSCSAKGGEELFIIGKNFLKGTKVIFQDNAADEQSWKAEAEIDMELFHQNHLIVKVPPYHSLAITSPVTVGLYAVTNAGRSHDVQSFTYTPEPGATDVTLKEEALSLATPCPVQEQMEEIQSGSCSPDSVPVPLVKREEVTPMEVSNTASAGCIFQQALDIRTSQQMDTSSSLPKIGTPFSRTRDPELQTALYATAEPLSTIQDLDIALTDSFQQRFLSKSGESLPRERTRGEAGAITGLLQMVESPAQPSQLSLFPQNSADQLSRLPAEGYSAPSLVQQVLEAAVQQRLSSVLFSPAPSAESTQHPARRDVNSPQLQSPEGSLAKQQQHQPQHVLENLQQQLQADLFEPDIPMHCGIFGGGSQSETTEQQGSPQCIVHNLQPSEGLLCRGSQQQQQEQQQATLFQQAEEFLSIQTSNFLQQRTSHPSPTQQLFHSPNPLAETHDPQGALFHTQKPSPCQGQVQATLFQDNLTVLTGSALSPKQEASPSNLFLSQSVSPGQLSDNSSPQQLAFLTSMRTSATETLFQPQRSPMDQSTSMEQQQSSQQQPQHPGSLFRNASPNSIGNALSQSQQKLQPGLLYCSNTLETMSNSLPSHETQETSVRFSQASLATIRNREEPAEPMSFQDQSSLVGSLPASEPHQQDLFRGQWSIQLASSSSSPSKQAASIFSPQSAISPLQGRVGSQELSQAAVFTAQNGVPGVHTSTSSTMQRSEALFQIAISGTMSQHNQAQQAGLFLYGIQNECSQPILSPGPTLSNQLPDPSGPKQQKNESQILSLFSESMSLSGSMQNGMSASQDMQKIDDLLESLQEQGNNILGSS